MATSRYAFVERVEQNKLSTTDVSSKIYFAVQQGLIPVNESKLIDKERLDHIAFKTYGEGSLWWVIAAASGIGWSLQCPPGTLLRVPTNLNDIYTLLR
jgi:hypothetical protein